MDNTTTDCMPVYIAGHLANTMHLTAAEHGAYFLLMMHAWKNRGVLPAESECLRTIARMKKKQWRKSGARLRDFFCEHNGRLIQVHLDHTT